MKGSNSARTARVTLCAVCLLPSLTAHGQMAGVTFQAQAQMTTKSGNVSGCGVSFQAVNVEGETIQGLAGSVNVFFDGSNGLASYKAGLYDMMLTGNASSPLRRVPSPFHLSWMRGEEGKAATAAKPEHIMQGQEPGMWMFATPIGGGLDVLTRITSGGKLWVGFKSDDGYERVFNGPLKWDPGADKQFDLCMQELIRSLEAALERIKK